MIKQKADAIITKYLPKIYGFAVSKSFGYDEAEELCSDILSELYRSLLAAGKIYNTDGYVWRISAHVYSKFVSSKKKHQGISIDGMEIPFQDEQFPCEDEEFFRVRREITFLTKVRREKVNIMVINGKADDFFAKIPSLDDAAKKEFAGYAFEKAEVFARNFPSQMRDLMISNYAGEFVSNNVAVMVMDMLYKNGIFKPLAENEKITSSLIMFCDKLPDA